MGNEISSSARPRNVGEAPPGVVVSQWPPDYSAALSSVYSNTFAISEPKFIIAAISTRRHMYVSYLRHNAIGCRLPPQIKKKGELIVVDTLLEEGLNDGDLPHLCLDKTLLMGSGHE